MKYKICKYERGKKMEKLKTNYLAILSSAVLIILCGYSLLIAATDVYESSLTKNAIAIALGVICTVVLLFLKDKHFRTAARACYILAIGVIFVNVLFPDYSLSSYIHLTDSILIFVPAVLPLTFMLCARHLTAYSSLDKKNTLRVFAAMLVVLMLIALVRNSVTFMVVALVVFFVTLVVACRQRKLCIKLPLLILIFAIIALMYVRFDIDFLIDKIVSYLFRNSYMRIFLDGIFANTPFIGQTEAVFDGEPALKYYGMWNDHHIVSILAHYGWALFLGVVAMYVIFFICLFKMTKATRQSSFAHYLSLMMTCYLAVQAIYSAIGLTLLDASALEFPFMMNTQTLTVTNFIAFATVLSLYVHRHEKSEIVELPYDDSAKAEENGLKSRFFGLLSYDDENDEDEEDVIITIDDFDGKSEHFKYVSVVNHKNEHIMVLKPLGSGKDRFFLLREIRASDKTEADTDGVEPEEANADFEEANAAAEDVNTVNEE